MTEDEKKARNNAACKRWREKNKEYDKERQKIYWENNPEKKREKHQRWYYSNHENALVKQRESYHRTKNNDRPSNKHEYQLWWHAKKRSTKSGVPFTIEREDVVIPPLCPCCNEEMLRSTMTAPTLDQLIAGAGYTKENTSVICRTCNTIKSFGSAEQHRRIAEFIDQANLSMSSKQ